MKVTFSVVQKLQEGERDYFGDLVEHISGATTSHISLPWLTTMLSSRTTDSVQNKLYEVVGLQEVPKSLDNGMCGVTTCVVKLIPSLLACIVEKRMERKRPCADGDQSKDMYVPLQVKTLKTKRKIKEKEGCKTVK